MTAQHLKQLREQAGLSITKAARSVHVSDRTWQRYEQGDKDIPEAIIELFSIKHGLEYPAGGKCG